jgi:hypothetical protein
MGCKVGMRMEWVEGNGHCWMAYWRVGWMDEAWSGALGRWWRKSQLDNCRGIKQ